MKPDWKAKLIEQINFVENAIDDASRQYHDSTRWSEEPSEYGNYNSPSLQAVIDNGFNLLREMVEEAAHDR